MDFSLECTKPKKKTTDSGEHITFEKYDRTVPETFLEDNISTLNSYIRVIEQAIETQEELDSFCSRLVETLKTEMNNKMSHRTVKLQPSVNNTKRKTKKPWWSDNLSELWNDQCKAEKNMLKGQKSDCKRLRHYYVTKRKLFNRAVQRAKRQYLRQKQAEIDETESKNQSMFWKEIGKIGVGQERRKTIPLEIVKPDGSVTTDKNEMLDKWRQDFESLLNPIETTTTPLNMSQSNTDNNHNTSPYFQDPIQLTEIELALKRMKANKATGIDEWKF